MTPEDKNRIIEILKEKSATLPCPRCGFQEFVLLDGYFHQFIQQELKGVQLGGPSIPYIITACKRCGFMSQHALGALGLLPSNINNLPKKEMK